jgi:benzoyl-CoA 2,3-dioxygenase component B
VSSNAASSFGNGIKGRPDETTQYQDHLCTEASYELSLPDGRGGSKQETVGMRNAMNEVLREAYIKDCEIGLKRWNAQIKRAGHGFELRLPSSRFRRAIGAWANVPTDLDGKLVSREEFERRLPEWTPGASDRAFVTSLMHRVVAPGKMAAWIAPPDRGINNLAVDYEYVRLA